MVKQKIAAPSNTKIAIVFFAFLFFVVGISLIFKTVIIIKASQFDDSKRFTLTIANNRNIEVMSLSSSSKDITVFKLKDKISSSDAGRLLEIPIDGFIAFDSLDLNKKTDSLFLDAAFKFNKLKTNLTIIDLARLIMFAKTIPESSVNVRIAGNTDELEPDKFVGRLVTDAFIEKDNQTIKIINGTGVSGLGSRLAKLITNMGGNVIIVATADSPIKKSFISYIDKKTYTVERLAKVLGYDAIKEVNDAISDITIVIGEDKANSLIF